MIETYEIRLNSKAGPLDIMRPAEPEKEHIHQTRTVEDDDKGPYALSTFNIDEIVTTILKGNLAKKKPEYHCENRYLNQIITAN